MANTKAMRLFITPELLNFTFGYIETPDFGDTLRLSMYTRFTSFLLAAGVLVPAAASAQSPGNGNGNGNGINYDTARLERKLAAAQAQGRIELDGRLDEASWRLAPV